MSWSTDMTGARGSVVALLLAGLALTLLTHGCFSDHACAVEICDGVDNDCDDKIDEGFVDATGLYVTNEHCGACGVSCAQQLPTAETTQCIALQGEPTCSIKSCPAGERVLSGSACVRDVPVLCLPCSTDAECELRSVGAHCLAEPGGSGRCGRACAQDEDCPQGYACAAAEGGKQCRPRSGSCVCDDASIDVQFACELQGRDGHICPGEQRCGDSGFGTCTTSVLELCNGQDDDCDQHIDEDFVDVAGRYVGTDHCGACGTRCMAPGPNMQASCRVDAQNVGCAVTCEEGFIDVDGLATTGCECKLRTGPDVVIGGDGDCNGEIDPTPELVFVSPLGNDSNDGTDVALPVATIGRGIAQGVALGRSVLVARGVYAESVGLQPGLILLGGYSPDFRERDVVLYPVLIEAPTPGDGKPLLRCTDITLGTYVDGLTIVASDSTVSSQGNTAVLLDGCGPAVNLVNIEVRAASGGHGVRGDDSSDRLDSLGLSSLSDLAGVDGNQGTSGGSASSACLPINGGQGGQLQCPARNVSGGQGGGAECPVLACANQSNTPCGNAGCTDFTTDGVCDIAAAKLVATPNPSAQNGKGPNAGKAGVATYNAPTNHNVCNFCDDNPSLPRNGDEGRDGREGGDGNAGAACTAKLVLDGNGRVAATSGGSGGLGGDGSGGGGGSAGAGYAVIGNTIGGCQSVAGGTGGGGGSGGCGAPGALGGGGGGTSVGILIRLASDSLGGPTLQGVRIVTADGGDGGDGGIGAAGGRGGSGGIGGIGNFWCARGGGRGGDGGGGGAAGGGGGGCGGSSFGTLLISQSGSDSYISALKNALAVESTGSGGGGGKGGFSPGHPGLDGRSGATEAVHVVNQ